MSKPKMNIHFVLGNKVAFSALLWHKNVMQLPKVVSNTVLYMKEACVKVKLPFRTIL